MQIPAGYREGYARARARNPALADRYIRHTLVGDPPADALVAALAPYGQEQAHRYIEAGMERDSAALRQAPAAVREFFDAISIPPAWFDPQYVIPGARAYFLNWDVFIGAHVLSVLVEGFSSLISKSFFMTGRLTDYGVRRLRQNNRHVIEICMPGGLERDGDGWKLSVRVKLVHAQVRKLLRESGDWDEAAWGTPLHMGHMAYAAAAFSALLLRRVRMLGVKLNAEESDSFIHLWRYVGWLFGVPEELLFRNEAEAYALCLVGFDCEPPPGWEAVAMANALINSAPLLAGMTDPAERRKFAEYLYRISRALIGDELADQLQFPRQRTTGLLLRARWQRRLIRLRERLAPGREGQRRAANFSLLMAQAFFDDGGLSYRLPDHSFADRSNPW